MISHPNLLIRKDGYAPLLWIGSFDSEREDAAYHFESYGYNLTFNRKVHFNQCAESWLFGITAFNFAIVKKNSCRVCGKRKKYLRKIFTLNRQPKSAQGFITKNT